MLPCFSKMLERIMFNRLQQYLKDQNILYDKQFGFRTDHSTVHCVMKCGVPRGSILGPLLFLLYVNDLKNASFVLDPIMFADDTNLFYTHSNMRKLFSTMNEELASINHQWFTSNKLSLKIFLFP